MLGQANAPAVGFGQWVRQEQQAEQQRELDHDDHGPAGIQKPGGGVTGSLAKW